MFSSQDPRDSHADVNICAKLIDEVRLMDKLNVPRILRHPSKGPVFRYRVVSFRRGEASTRTPGQQ